jgi:hypothetical protein
VLALASVVPAPLGAQTQERFSFKGFGGWAFSDMSRDGRWGEVATRDGEYGNYSFALNLAAKPTAQLSLRSQAFAGQNLRGHRTKVDYAFAEYAFGPAFKLRAGKALSPFGLYSEIYDVGTLRPFFYLPQFYQGRLGLIPKAYVGGGATGMRSLGSDWEISYDAFGGEMQFEPFTRTLLKGVDRSTRLPIVEDVEAQLHGRKMAGARLLLSSPARGFDVGGSVIRIGDLKQRAADGRRVPFPTGPDGTLVNGRVQFQRGRFAARAEFFEAFTDAADVPSFYVEASRKLGRRVEIAAQYEKTDLQLLPGDNSVPPPLRRHESFGAGASFWPTRELVLKLNAYRVLGNLLNRPQDSIVKYLTGTLDTTSTVVVLGAQFAF